MKCLWEYWLFCFSKAHIIVLNPIPFKNIRFRIQNLNPNHVRSTLQILPRSARRTHIHARRAQLVHMHTGIRLIQNWRTSTTFIAYALSDNQQMKWIACICNRQKRSESKWKMILHPTLLRSSSKCDQKSTIIVSRIVRIACPPSYPLLFAQR